MGGGGRVVADDDPPPLRQVVLLPGNTRVSLNCSSGNRQPSTSATSSPWSSCLSMYVPAYLRSSASRCRRAKCGFSAVWPRVTWTPVSASFSPSARRSRSSRTRFGVVVMTIRGFSPLRSAGMQALVVEGHVPDDGQLIEPAVRQVLPADRVRFLGGEPADLRLVGEGDLEPVLVVVP